LTALLLSTGKRSI